MVNNPNIKITCDFCNGILISFYKVPDSGRGIIVYVCEECGLVQSISTKKNSLMKKEASISSGATWGNIRHSKGLRLKTAIPILRNKVAWSNINKVLDVGSNRGDFVNWINKEKNQIEITAIEPDRTIVDSYINNGSIRTIIGKLENVNLDKENFDFIYCCHTLEHADSASDMINKIYNLLKPGGYFYLDVPNIDVISLEDQVEEFFIDKHTFHFNRPLLADYLKNMGFQILTGEYDNDNYNIVMLLRKEKKKVSIEFNTQKNGLPKYNKAMINSYIINLKINRGKLPDIVAKINPFFDRQKVAVWGAGKIFDALVRFGGLNAKKLECVVDEYLWKIVHEAHGVNIESPFILKIKNPDVVLILAHSSTEEITNKVRKLGIRNVISFNQLLSSVD